MQQTAHQLNMVSVISIETTVILYNSCTSKISISKHDIFLIQKLIKIKYTTPVFSFILLSLIFYPFSTYKLDDLHSEFRKCKDDVKTRTRQTTATMITHLVKMTVYANSSMKSRGELNTFYNKINYNLKMFVVRSTRRLLTRLRWFKLEDKVRGRVWL